MKPIADNLNLTARIADEIRAKLVHGELVPGQRLSEAAMSEALDISRNTLREVFRTLTKEGLLVHEPNKGVSVAVPSMAAIIDIYRVRRLIECQSLEKAWPLHPAHQRMQRAVEDALAARQARDWRQVGSANMEFHAGIVALSDSERLSAMFEHLAAELRLAFGMLDDAEYLHAPYVDYNVRLLEMLLAGHTQEAARELETYLVQSERMVLAVYARQVP